MLVALATILGLALGVWGGVLVARLVANRLEHGMRWWRLRKRPDDPSPPARSLPPKRPLAWSLLGLVALALGGLSVAGGVYTSSIESDSWQRDAEFDAALAAGAAMTLSFAAGLFVVGWRFDPARGRRRCPKCWYDMSATTSRRCPECGHEEAHERGLYRSRRSRLTIAIACVPMLALCFLPLVSNVKRYGAIGLVPTTFMIAFWEHLPEHLIEYGNVQADGCLRERLDDDATWEWQVRWYERRCARVVRDSNDPILVAKLVQRSDTDEFLDAKRAKVFAFIDRLQDPDPVVREAAATVLMHCFPEDAVVERPTPAQLELLWAATLAKDPYPATICGDVLFSLGIPLTPEHANALGAIARDFTLSQNRRVMALYSLGRWAESNEFARAIMRRGWRDADDAHAALCIRLGRKAVRDPADVSELFSLVDSAGPLRAGAAALTLSRLKHAPCERLVARIEREPEVAAPLASALLEVVLSEDGYAHMEDPTPLLPRYERALPALAAAFQRTDTLTPAELDALATLLGPAIGHFPALRPIFERLAGDAGAPLSVRERAGRIVGQVSPQGD